MGKLMFNGIDYTGGASNNGHTYSTDEQVVGTWIDGSPVYERTVVAIGDMTQNAWTAIVDASSWNIGTVVSFNGSYIRYWSGSPPLYKLLP